MAGPEVARLHRRTAALLDGWYHPTAWGSETRRWLTDGRY